MKLMPVRTQWPLTPGMNHDDLIVWLAYREAKALLTKPRTANP